MILCYFVELFATIIITSIDWIIYYIPDDIKCFLSHPFTLILLNFLALIIIIISVFVYICILNIKWEREKRDFEFRRRHWR